MNDTSNNSDKQNTEVTKLDDKHISKFIGSLYDMKLLKFIAILFIIVGGISFIKEYTKAMKYEETIGILENYDSCNENGCQAIYSYEVNGEKYYASPDLISDSFKETAKVYYNPESPSENVMNSNWHVLFIGGCVILMITKIFGKRTIAKFNNEERSSSAIKI